MHADPTLHLVVSIHHTQVQALGIHRSVWALGQESCICFTPSLCCSFSHCSYRPILQILCSALCSEDRPLRTPLRDSLSWIHLPSGFWLIWEDGCHWLEANGRKKNRVFILVGCWHFCAESLDSCQAVVSSICSTHWSFL